MHTISKTFSTILTLSYMSDTPSAEIVKKVLDLARLNRARDDSTAEFRLTDSREAGLA
jgi:hypothetical protein